MVEQQGEVIRFCNGDATTWHGRCCICRPVKTGSDLPEHCNHNFVSLW